MSLYLLQSELCLNLRSVDQQAQLAPGSNLTEPWRSMYMCVWLCVCVCVTGILITAVNMSMSVNQYGLFILSQLIMTFLEKWRPFPSHKKQCLYYISNESSLKKSILI